MGRPAGTLDLAPKIRRAFMGAAKRLDSKGVSLSALIERELEHNTLATLKVMASFNPRQVNVDKKTTIEINEIISVVTQRQKEKLIKGEVLADETKALTIEAGSPDEPNAIVPDVDSFTQSITPNEVTVEPSS